MIRLIVTVFMVVTWSVTAQEIQQSLNYENEELQDVLAELETTFNVKFSYNTTSFKNIPISFTLDAVMLPQVITHIQRQANVIFTKIDERYYVVKKDNSISVCGSLKSAVNGNVIQGATIVIIGKNDGTISNENGFF